MTPDTYQHQFLASNTNSSVECSVTRVILYGDVSATLQKSVDNSELFWEDGGVKRSFTWFVSIINPWKKSVDFIGELRFLEY